MIIWGGYANELSNSGSRYSLEPTLGRLPALLTPLLAESRRLQSGPAMK
jgi:hypothetical protein